MKKVILGLLFILAGMAGVQAQRNTLLIYGNVNIGSGTVGSTSINNYTIAPGIGYQWNDNWTGGINLTNGGSSATTTSGKTSGLSVGPFIRYTQPLGGIFAIYGQFNANFLSGKANAITYSGFESTLFPAIGVNLKNSFALNFTFGSLSFTSQKVEGAANTTNTFHVGFGSGAGFGISKNFGLTK